MQESTIQEKLAYIAGIIDGEGCVSLHTVRCKKGGYINHKIIISVTNSSQNLMEWLISNFGGSYHRVSTENKKWKTYYAWRLYSQKARHLLEMVKPYLLIKQKQAELLIAYASLQDVKTYTCNGISKIDPKLRFELYDAMKFLNFRGALPVETNTPDINSLLMKIESELKRNLERQSRETQSTQVFSES